jgi:hypothetical protein
MVAERALPLAALLCVLLAACAGPRGPASPELRAAAQQHDALAVSDALEALIGAGRDKPVDREYAYKVVTAQEQDTAAYAYARAAVTGRLVQQRGLLGANLIGDVEHWALRSRELDPNFRDGAATRLLGTLYVIAPSSFLKHGDSEQGLEMLEELAAAHPEVLENHLRLAEAYIALGDHAPAAPHLCLCLANRDSMRPDDQRLLDDLVRVTGAPDCVAVH